MKGSKLVHVEFSFDKIAKFLSLFVLFFYLLSVSILQKDSFAANIFVFGTMIFIITMLLTYFLSKSVSNDLFAKVILIFISVLIFGIWNYVYHSQPVSDYRVLLDGAKSIVDGNFADQAANNKDYFRFYNFQIGYTFYLSIFVKLFSNSLVALKVIEMIIITATNIILYKIIRLYRGVQESLFCGIIATIFPWIFMGSGIINNQHIGMLLTLSSIYCILRKTNILHCILCGFLLSLSQTLRPTAMVVLVAVFFCLIVNSFILQKFQNIVGAFVLAGTYIVTNLIINHCFILSGLAPYGIKNDNPFFKIVLGLTGGGITGQPTTDARHTQLYYDLEYFQFNYDKYKSAAKKFLFDLIVNRKISFDSLTRKIVSFAGGLDNQIKFGDRNFNTNHQFLIGCLNLSGLYFYFVSILFSVINFLKRKKIVSKLEEFLPIFIFFLFFCAYVIIETQTRYRYEQYYMLLILSTPCLFHFMENLERRFVLNKTQYFSEI